MDKNRLPVPVRVLLPTGSIRVSGLLSNRLLDSAMDMGRSGGGRVTEALSVRMGREPNWFTSLLSGMIVRRQCNRNANPFS